MMQIASKKGGRTSLCEGNGALGALQTASAVFDRLADLDDHIVVGDVVHRLGAKR